MVQEPRRRLEQLLAADRQSPEHEQASSMALICARCVSELAVSGAGATVLSRVGGGSDPSRGLVHASNHVSARLDDLQFTVGEGPCLETFDFGGPVLVSELASETTRWPGFTQGALELGVAAVFSFPLQIGVVRLGSLDCYRDAPGSLSEAQLTDALILAELATHAVIAELEGHVTHDVGWLADPHAEVHQAAGMVQVQLGTTIEAALLRLRGYAYTHGLSLAEVASRVVDRSLRFTSEDS